MWLGTSCRQRRSRPTCTQLNCRNVLTIPCPRGESVPITFPSPTSTALSHAVSRVLCTECLGGTVRRDRSPACKASWCETQLTGTVATSCCQLPAPHCCCSQTNPGSEKFLRSSVHLAKLSYKIHLRTITESSELKRILGYSHCIKLLLF